MVESSDTKYGRRFCKKNPAAGIYQLNSTSSLQVLHAQKMLRADEATGIKAYPEQDLYLEEVVAEVENIEISDERA